MIDFGFDKLALIGAVALIVIGPEKLPRVARTVGHFIGKAQRYVADVKAEVNRSIELEELHKMKSQFETAARDVSQSVQQEVQQAASAVESAWKPEGSAEYTGLETTPPESVSASGWTPAYQPPRKRWRMKRGSVPRWYKQREGVRMHVQSGAARVARFRPPRSGA